MIGIGRLSSLATAVTVALAAFCGSAAVAEASIGPASITLSPSSGTAASTANLGTDIKFNPSGGDTAKDLTLQLPPGLLSNAGIDHGACLTTTTPIAACQVGSGAVTAASAGVPLTLNATFDLVAPPSPSDLAGLAVLVTPPLMQPTQLGTPAAITVRPPSSPLGAGLAIAFTNIPNTFDGLSISLQEIKATFDSLRFPSSCPAMPASFLVTADSYSSSTPVSAHAPLKVTGCAAAPFAPHFKVTATRDASDPEVAVTTTITQTAAEVDSSSVVLSLPTSVLGLNVGATSNLCANVASGTCTAIGSASATSPLYPRTLTGTAYLTGSFTSPGITLTFPPPFALTLTGAVSLATGSTTFNGLPDIPLTNLSVTLFGGPTGAFRTSCLIPSGTATATLTDQNGDRTVTAPGPFTVSGCPTAAGGGTQITPGGSSGRHGRPRITSASLSGLASGQPSLFFALASGRGGRRIHRFAIKLGTGLSFAASGGSRIHAFPGLRVGHARIKSVTLTNGRLIVVLRKPVSSLSVKIGPPTLRESASLRRLAKLGRLRKLRISVVVTNAAGRSFKLTMTARSPKRGG